jgi:hypothetical protein
MLSARMRLPRLKTRCGVQLSRVDDHGIVITDTDNLDDEGFYCTSDQPFSPGDRLEYEVFVPSEGPDFRGPNLILHGLATVLRVELRRLGPGFGIFCRFDDQPVTE